MKTTITAIAFTLITFASFAQTAEVVNPKDHNIPAVLDSMGIATIVDAEALEAKFPSVKLNAAKGELKMKFHNPNKANYTLYVYDVNGDIVEGQMDITNGKVVVTQGNLPAALYTYQLRGEGNIYCGRFLFN